MDAVENEMMEYFSKLTENIDLSNLAENFATTTELEKIFQLSRTNASKIANRLVKNQFLFKINTRPVLFAKRSSFEKKYSVIVSENYDSLKEFSDELQEIPSTQIFTKMIGYNKSLREAIKQMKTAVSYPGKGLPMMITGDTGVGKSYFAKITHEYMIREQVIFENAPYKSLNCAQYYNNPELLSGLLFGYSKGAFTGATEDHPGLLEEANNGILFLDEVHRLSGEGQEKLFTFMDTEEFSRVGEIKNRKSIVRLIFATTESEKNFLDTFIRRIPIHIYIPNIKERDILEKKQMIEYLYLKESQQLEVSIEVTPRVLNVLLQAEYQGNIGDLENVIKYSCGSAVASQAEEVERIVINLRDLPNHVYQKMEYSETTLNLEGENIIFDPRKSETQQLLIPEEKNQLFVRLIEEYRKLDRQDTTITEKVSRITTNLIDEMLYQTRQDNKLTIEKFIVDTLQELFREFDQRYRIHYDGEFVTSVSHYIYKYVLKERNEQVIVPIEIATLIREHYTQESTTMKKIIPIIENRLDVVFNEIDRIMITLFFSTLRHDKKVSNIDALLIAHGYATASSMSNVVNKMLGKRIFTGIDMPIESTVFDISEKVLDYLAENKAEDGLIVLIDMGSLNLLYKELQQIAQIPLLFIDQLNTVMTLEIGNLIDQGKNLKEIGEIMEEPIQPNVQLYMPTRKQSQAIITTCFTGIGTAVQIQQLLIDCFDGIMDMQILPMEFGYLKQSGIPEEVRHKYEIRAIIGTDDPKIAEIPFIHLEQLISADGDQQVNQFFSDLIPENMLIEVNNRLVKSFSLIRVIDSLTILDTKKILKIIEGTLIELEQRLTLTLSNARKISFYVHISCMVERLIRQSEIQDYPDLDKFSFDHQREIRVIQDVLSVIESTYSVKITLPEIAYIHNIIY